MPAAPLLRAAERIAAGRPEYDGCAVALGAEEPWRPAQAPAAWLAAHHRLAALWPLAVAASVETAPGRRAAWYRMARGLIATWLREARGQAVDRTVAARRIAAVLACREVFAADIAADPDFARAMLQRVAAESGALHARVAEWPADPWTFAVARALVLAGHTFEGPEARVWFDRGVELFWGALRAQVTDDGGHVSRSPAWQAFVLEDAAHVLAVLRHAGAALPAWAAKRLRGMCDVLARTTFGDGSLVRLGEGAPGGWWSPGELVATVAAVTGAGEVAPPGPLPGVLPRLLLTEADRRRYAVLPRRPAHPESRAIRRMGIFVVAGSPGDALVVDGGAPHPGAEPFGYELAAGGLPLLVSSWDGRPRRDALAEYPASPRAQNVVVGEQSGAGGTAPSAAGPLVQWAVRDGLTRFVGAWHRRRRIVLGRPGGFWLVLDEVRGVGPWRGESLVHVHPEATLFVRANGRTMVDVARSAAARVRVAFAGTRAIQVVGGGGGPNAQGWLARGDGPAAPAPTLAATVAGTLPVLAGYAIVPRTDEPVTLDLVHEPLRIAAVLRIGHATTRIEIVQDEIDVRDDPA